MAVLALIWWTAAIGGLVAGLVGITVRSRRRESLLIAGGLFAVAGVLGILSIGIIFVVFSAACIVAATRTDAPVGAHAGHSTQ